MAASAEAAAAPRAAPRKKARPALFEALPKPEQRDDTELQTNGSTATKPARPKQPTPRKRAPTTRRAEQPAIELPAQAPAARPPAEPVVVPEVVVPEVVESPITAELQVFDDLLVYEDPVLQAPPAVDRTEKPAFKKVSAKAKIAAPVLEERVADMTVSRDLDFFDDLDFEERAVEGRVEKPPVVDKREKRVEALVPYVLPKIIPGEPDPVPDELPTESPDELIPDALVPDALVVPKPEKGKVVAAFRPKLLRATKKLAQSLQPVIVPRHRPRVRRVTRVVRHIDTWSVFKIALLFNIFLYAVCLTAGAMLWRVALNTGTIENVERFFESFGWQTFELKGGEIYHNAWIAGLFGVVGLTGVAVLAATMFNLITDLVGGVRVTVLEEEVIAREQRVTTWPRLLRPPPPSRNEPQTD